MPESGDYRYPPAAGAAQPEEDRHFVAVGPATPWPTASPGQDMASVPGFSLETSRRPSGLPTAHAPAPAVFLRNYQPGRDPLSRRVPLPRRSASSSGGGAVRNSRARATHWGSPAHHNSDHGRLPHGMGVTAGAALLMGTGPAPGYSPISMCWSFRLSFCHSITSSPLFGTALYLSVRTTSQLLHT